MRDSLGSQSEQFTLFHTKNLWLLVILCLHFLEFYRLYNIRKPSFLWIHPHVVISQRTFKLHSSRCALSASVMPAIISGWYSSLFGVRVEDFLWKRLVKCALLRYAERTDLCCLRKTFLSLKSTRGRLSCFAAVRIKNAASLGHFGWFATGKMICFYFVRKVILAKDSIFVKIGHVKVCACWGF